MAPTLKTLLMHGLLFSLTPFLFYGCGDGTVPISSGCLNCHQIQLDKNHQLPCTSCHKGDGEEKTLEKAHEDLVVQPAHPDNDELFCGPCHAEEIKMVNANNHYTLAAHVKLTRLEKKPGTEPAMITDIKSFTAPNNHQELIDDLLRRRCFRCHVYSGGDEYAHTSRATGCGACHLKYYNKKLQSHKFTKVSDDTTCLSCHYGNHVGFDYYGRFEHDFNEEYRTPYTTRKEFFRPYGVEYHQLEPDIHQQAGMLCVDCHVREQVMGGNHLKADCNQCHNSIFLEQDDIPSVSNVDDRYIFTSPATGKIFSLPVMQHPAHQKYNNDVNCQVCHAQWSFNDTETHLLRIDHDDFDEFERLSLDGDSHVNMILNSHIDFYADAQDPLTDDYFTDKSYPGIWLKGYSERRWENTQYTSNQSGQLCISRPILNLHLSWIDTNEVVRFNNIVPFSFHSTSLPYIPHTTGTAGVFYEERLKQYNILHSVQKSVNSVQKD